MRVAEEIKELKVRAEKSFKAASEKIARVGETILEKTPDIARSMAILTATGIVVASSISAVAVAFPTITTVATVAIPILFMLIQMGVAVIVITLIISVAKRLIE